MSLAGRLPLPAALRRAVRSARGLLRPAPGWDASLGPVEVDGAVVALRPPRLADGPAWRSARLRLRAELEPWWPTHRDWAEEHTDLEWAAWCTGVRAAARRGLAQPFVVLVDGELRGQVGVDAIDRGTGAGELSVWLDAAAVPARTADVAVALVCRHAFGVAEPPSRLVGPVAVTNPRPRGVLRRLGFEREATLTAYRATSAGRVDHDLFALHPGAATTARLDAVLAEHSRPVAVPAGPPAPRPRARSGVVLARLGVRRARAAVRELRAPDPDDEPLADVVVGGHRVVLRPPRTGDFAAWRAARLQTRDELEPWWPAVADWAGEHTAERWAQEVHHLRRARRDGALPGVLELDGVFAGQLGVDAVDLGTGTGEVSAWATAEGRAGAVVPVAGLAMVLAAFTGPRPLARLVAPVAVGNPAAAAAARSFGFTEDGVLRAYRPTSAGPTDHRMFVLVNSEETVDRLRRRLAALSGA